MERRTVPAKISALGDNEVLIRMSTGQRARDGHILVPEGCILDNYRLNPIQLWQHLPEEPVGCNSDINVTPEGIEARMTFAPAGISPVADKVRGLVKSGVVRAVSIGFDIIEGEPIDPSRPRAGLRASKWELLECSFVSVPSDTGATVTARAAGDADWKLGAARDLPIENSDAWDGPAAEASLFEHAGGEDFDPSKARLGFLVYDAAHPKLRGSYKLPIAHVVDGALKVPKGAIRAAASRLPQADIPDGIGKAAAEVLDHYKEKAGMTEPPEEARAFAAKRLRMLRGRVAERASAGSSGTALVFEVAPHGVRGLHDCGSLAWSLANLGYLHNDALWEAECEGDNSPVPAMLGEALKSLGQTLIAMTKEEVLELLDGHGVDVDPGLDDALPAAERAFLAGAKTPRARAWRRGIAMARAGKTLSNANAAKLDEAIGHLDKGSARAKDAADNTAAASAGHEALSDLHGKAVSAHDKMGAAIEAANGSATQEVAAELAKVQQHHKALGKHLDGMGDRCAAIGDAQADAMGAITGAQRCVRSAMRCVRGVRGGAPDADTPDSDVQDIQTSDGDGESDGSANGRAFTLDARRRRLAALELAAR